ncbi:MAG: hypothetical protein HYX92_10725 [Chloroflexi bacterium]|nr:hypothetical protein [Chloroflexota bacterium]
MPTMIEGLDPAAEVKAKPQRKPNPFPTELRGKTLGFLNGDGGGQHLRIDNLFDALQKQLNDKYRFGEVIRRAKWRTKTGQGASEETLNELAARSDVVISGVGL